MAYEVRIQPTALKELESIVAYLLNFGPNTAGAFLDEWEGLLQELEDGIVEHGLSRFDVLTRLGYRAVIMKNYIVLYFKEGNSVVVSHIFHQSQDYASIVINGR